MVSYIFKQDFESFRLIVVVVTGYLNLRLLYKVSLPLSLLRKILLSICTISFCLLLLIFSDFFLIKTFNFISCIFIIIFIFVDNYIALFLEEIYDKIVLTMERKKEKDG